MFFRAETAEFLKSEALGCPALVEGYVHLGVTARSCCIHSGHNLFDMAAQSGPLLIADNHERDFPAFQVLLVTDVFIGGHQNIETFRLGNRYQFAVQKPVPSSFDGLNHNMSLECRPERRWGTVVKEYEHRVLKRGTASAARQGFAPRIR